MSIPFPGRLPMVVEKPVMFRYTADSWSLSHGELSCEVFQILKKTPKGVWIEDWRRVGGKRFVLLSAHKQFACETKEKALESFLARKKRQGAILRGQLEACYEAERIGKALQQSRGEGQ